ncbi:hypothetical protein ACFL0H_03640 [Thermodesulfobacteriota bacterium]
MDEYNESTELPRQFDIVMEMEKALDEIDREIEMDNIGDVIDLLSYLRFLVKDLDDIFSGEYDNLRHRKFILKRK